ncbi:hypothetical protein ES705_17658 [subsurface metagenome]
MPIYQNTISGALYQVTNDSVQRGLIIANDAYGNKSTVTFFFRKSTKDGTEIPDRDDSKFVKWNEGAEFKTDNATIRIPPGALYRDISFHYSKIPSPSVFSDTLIIHKESEPLHKKFTIKLTPDSIPKSLESKLILARIDGNNKLSSEGGEWINGQLNVYTRNFGKFIIVADTLAPIIVPENFTENGEFLKGQKITFKVEDELSGLKSYNAYIDNKWALLEYDAKSHTMSYTIDNEKLDSGKIHSLKLHLVDMKNNIAVFESQFNY